MLLCLVDIKRKMGIPVGYRFLTKKEDPNHISGMDIAVDLVKEAISEGFPKLPGVALKMAMVLSCNLRKLLCCSKHNAGNVLISFQLA